MNYYQNKTSNKKNYSTNSNSLLTNKANYSDNNHLSRNRKSHNSNYTFRRYNSSSKAKSSVLHSNKSHIKRKLKGTKNRLVTSSRIMIKLRAGLSCWRMWRMKRNNFKRSMSNLRSRVNNLLVKIHSLPSWQPNCSNLGKSSKTFSHKSLLLNQPFPNNLTSNKRSNRTKR